VERIAAEKPPMLCYGSEQTPSNPLCPGCKYRQGCAELMGDLAGRVNVAEAKFRFVPPLLQRRFTVDDAFRADLDLSNIEKVYAFCYTWVFGDSRRNSVVRRLGKYSDLVLLRVRQAETSIKLFLLANMYGWKQSHATEFHPKVLTVEHSLEVFRTYAEICNRTYGTFDTTSLDKLMAKEGDLAWVEDSLFKSEIVAGSWIIRYKLFHSGDIPQKLYAECEESLNPYWLAIEPSYFTWVFHDHLEFPNPDLVSTLKNHRWSVSHILGRLKTQPRRSLLVFNLRERIMPKAVKYVLGLRGYLPEDFHIHDDAPVTNAIRFWTQLAVAIQQFECIKFVNKNPSAFDSLKIGSGH
jgi:hypothetical protein